jgi:HD-like signal output (HDOD) protein
MQERQTFIDSIKAFMGSNKAILPVFSAIGLRIQREAAKDDPDIKVIEEMITREPTLTSQVLHISNSVFYKGVQKVTTVAGAILRMGSREVANTAILLSQRGQFSARDQLVNTLMQNLWRHSVGCAVASHWIVTHCRLQSNAQEAFTAGLLHDMGKLLLLTVTDGAKQSGYLPKMPTAALLLDILNDLHALYGYALLSQWNIPDAYCKIARDHHTPDPDGNDELMMVVRLANAATNCQGIGLRQPDDGTLTDLRQAAHFELDENDVVALNQRLEDTKVFW